MISSKLTGLLILPLLFCIFGSTTVSASEPQVEITHLVIKNTADTLQVDLKIDSEFAAELNEAVLAGVPVRFTFSISLYEVNDFWFDTKVVGQTAIHELRYDVTKRVFKLIRSRGVLRPVYIEDFEKARVHISEINNLKVISLKELNKGEHYQLMVGAGLSVRKYAFFNLFREVKNDHYTINFIY
jgi:hypothetical protein